MPLNPPSYSGQDVWYSQNVFINKVQAALWQPPQPIDTKMKSIPVISSPSYEFSSDQQSMIAGSVDKEATQLVDADGNPVSQQEGDGISPDAAPGQDSGPTASSVDPETLPPGTDPYTNLYNNLNTVLKEAKGGSWRGSLGNTNIQHMLTVTGVPSYVITSQVWCATFVSYMLKISGCQYTVGANSKHVSTSAADYRTYGDAVDIHDPKTWRKGDVITVTRSGGSGFHVAFLWGLTSSNVILMGGNQGNNVCAVNWYSGTRLGTGQSRIGSIRRAWQIPPALDVPLPNA